MYVLLWLCVAVVGSDTPWLVVLRNGQEQRATAVEQAADTMRLHFPEGSMQIATVDVAAVRKVDDSQLRRPEDAGIQTIASAERRFTINNTTLTAQIPQEYRRSRNSDDSPPGKRIVEFQEPKSERVIHIVRSDHAPKDDNTATASFWAQLPAIRQHHRESYPGYRMLGERFVLSEGQQGWLLRFAYQKGEQQWTECQGFFIVGANVIAVSAASSSADTTFDGEQLVRSIGRSLHD
ncbi:MAG: hypothetical protein AAF581_07315 [Planctomycetota bacterium]